MSRAVVLPLAGALSTAVAMALAGWGAPSIAIAGPRAGPRIAALVPQIEVLAVLAIGVSLAGGIVDAGQSSGFRQALAATARGPAYAVARTASAHLGVLARLLGGGAILWLLASRLPGGPTLRDIAASRLLLAAFAVFGAGLSAWAFAVCAGRAAAFAVRASVLIAMIAMPFAAAPVISTAGARRGLIAAVMLACPWIVTAGATGLDLLHMEWLYAFSPLGSVEAPYPGLIVPVAAYGGTGMVMLALAAHALRRGGTRTVA